MDVFVSHSSKDHELIEELIHLLEKALGIDPKSIRATSVSGYKLDPGVDTDEKLRAELRQFKVLVGVLTPDSLRSAYVMFELGARWGQKLPIAPICAKGVSGQHLKGPISGLNALCADSEADLHHFLRAIGDKLGLSLREPASFTKQLKKVAYLAAVEPTTEDSSGPSENIRYEAPYYFKVAADGTKEGPFCQNCYDSAKKLIRLQTRLTSGVWTCQNCKNSVTDSSYQPRPPIRAIRA